MNTKMKQSLRVNTFSTLLAVITGLTFMSMSTIAQASSLTATQAQQVKDITVFLTKNPELIENLHQSITQYNLQQKGVAAVLADNHDYIFNNPNHPTFGAENPAIEIINFTDYSCPWCKKLDPVLQELIVRHPDKIKVITLLVPLKEMSNGSNSSSYALNVWRNSPEHFTNVNKYLIAKPGVHNANSVNKVANKTNTAAQIGATDLSADIINKNYNLFQGLGLRGTPAMVINGEVMPGFMPLDRLEPAVLSLMK